MKEHDDSQHEEQDFSFNKDGKGSFGMPSDYFSSFEEKLRKKLEAAEELNEFPLLSAISKETGFGVPQDYFSASGQSLECRAELAGYPTLQGIAKVAAPDLEEAYQLQLRRSLDHKLELAEELRPYEALSALDKVNPFPVADAYFESLSLRVRERLSEEREEKIPLADRILNLLFGPKAAWAFGLSLIVTLALFFRQQPATGGFESGDCKTLACLETYEILNNNKVITSFDEEQLIELVDVKTLGKQLNLDQKADSLLRNKQSREDEGTEELLEIL